MVSSHRQSVKKQLSQRRNVYETLRSVDARDGLEKR